MTVALRKRERVYSILAHSVRSKYVFVFYFNQLYFTGPFSRHYDVAVLSELKRRNNVVKLIYLLARLKLIKIYIVLRLWLSKRVQIDASRNTDSYYVLGTKVNSVDVHF